MTVKIRQFGTAFVTRHRAKQVLKAVDPSCGFPTLDFSDVEVANLEQRLLTNLGRDSLPNSLCPTFLA